MKKLKLLKDFRIIEIVYATGIHTFFIEELGIESYLFGLIKITTSTRVQNHSHGYDTKESALSGINRYMKYYNDQVQLETKIHTLS